MASLALSKVVVLLAVVLSCLWRTVEGDYYPVYGRDSAVFFNASTDSKRYPDFEHIVEASYEYFLSDLDFDVLDGKIVCGAADKLYILDSTDLSEVQSYTWEPDNSKKTTCESQNSDTQTFTCRNHIRVHRPIPTVTDSTALFVCGSQATKTPQCRVVEVQADGTLQGFTTVDASPGIVSYYPGFSQFGEFREESNTDTTYFSAGFFEGNSGLGRHFSISYQAISVSDSPSANTLTTTERFRTISANNNWLRYPVTFVDYLRLDYEPFVGGNDYDYQFYFAFIRENLYSAATSSDDIIQSRVVRICRNDQGFTPAPSTADSNDLPYFTTYMKARIYCERQLETDDQYDGAIKYLYNELRSVAFTTGGRFYGGGEYQKMLYGAFAGPVVGPHGTALCAYSAENSAEESTGTGRTQSMFDIFREDLETPDGTREENNYVECNPAGRSDVEAQNILVNREKFVSQIGSDPLIVLDGLLVNQMVVDEQCVVKMGDSSKCSNQDVLFLGTDAGKVVKVVFASRGNGMTNVFPVIVEEIALDDDNTIEKMIIKDEEDERYLFVNTNSKIYKFPLARCSRHQSCLECVGSRDPYCVWDSNSADKKCISNPYQAVQNGDTTVESRYKQNIHTGEDATSQCSAEAHCDIITSILGYDTVQVECTCSDADQVTVAVPSANGLTVTDASITLDSDGKGSTTITGSIGLQSYGIEVTAEGSVFTSIVTTPPGPPIIPTMEEVLIDSITSTSFRVNLNINLFTDYFTEYSFQIEGAGITADLQPFSTSTSYTVTNLTPATTYTYTVVLHNSVGMVTTESFTTVTLDDVPSVVRSLVPMPDDVIVTLAWMEPATTNGDIIGYSVKVGESEVRGCGGWSGAPGTTYDVTGLTPFTSYDFEVAACTSAGEGPAATVSSTTLCSMPGQVTNLQFPSSGVTANSLGYSWSQPDTINGDISTLQYMVLTTCYNEDGVTTTTQTVTTIQGTLSDLSPLTLCCVRVNAINNCGGQSPIQGTPTEACEQTLNIIPEAVTSLSVEGVNQEGILVTWNPPSNYEKSGLEYIISVSAPGFSGTEVTTNDRGYAYIGSLDPSTEYNVTVTARSGLGVGPAVTVSDSTLPSSPPPPSNPVLTVEDDMVVTLQLDWNFADASMYQVTGYEAVLRCNEAEPVTKMTSDLSVTFDVSDPGSNFAWCTAQVQAINDVGRGQFSDLTSIAIPSQRPSTPRCYIVNDEGSSVTISFDVTHPFSLDSLTIRYKLVADFESSASVDEEVMPFTSLSTNVLTLPVSRNTGYDFQLQVCNIVGCSDYCNQLQNFTTSSTAPRPPSDISVAVTHNSTSLSWSVPNNENASVITFILQLSSSGSGGGMHILPGTQTDLDIPNLDAQTVYAVAIQVNDTVTGTVGLFGPVESFTTLIGTPSMPQSLEADWKLGQELLTVTWGAPRTPNGTITRYEIIYSDDLIQNCNKPEGNVVRNDSLPTYDRGFDTRNTSNILQKSSILVCVRAYTDKPGSWASVILKNANVGGLGSQSEADCNGLIAVAAVAVFAVCSTILACIVLCVVVRCTYNNQVMDNKSNRSEEEGKMSPAPSQSGQSTDTGFNDDLRDHHRPPFSSQESTRSTKHLL